jgi:hypothetical protein
MLISQFGSGDRERQRRSYQDPAISNGLLEANSSRHARMY